MGPSWSYGRWWCAISGITTKVLSSNPVHGEVCSIQLYVIKFVSDFRQIGTPASSTNKTDRHDATEILLKVVLNTITLTFISVNVTFSKSRLEV